jgi:hypothetical protein
LLRDPFCVGEGFWVIPLGFAEGRVDAFEPVRPSADKLTGFRSVRRFLAVGNSLQSIAENDGEIHIVANSVFNA